VKTPVIEIMKDLFFVERGYLNCNHFVYRGKKPVLIDTGYVRDFDRTAQAIEGLGVDLSRVRLIINTHTHSDHIGGNRSIQERSNCDIALHRFGKHFIDTLDDWSTWWRYYSQAADFFKCTIALEDGDMVDVGPYEFQVIYTPGHAADGIVLYHSGSGVLISSDTLWEDDMAVMTLPVEGSRALFFHLESLDRLADLEITTVYPGHGQPFTDVKKAISSARRRVKGMLEKRERIGDDQLKKIMIYTLLMYGSVDEARFFDQLMGTFWFRGTIDMYFNGEYEAKYDEVMTGLFKRDLVRRRGSLIYSSVKP
jgi:glyoxylase-like metal-dependent hydrolase (beta-lactamase superfamily II)